MIVYPVFSIRPEYGDYHGLERICATEERAEALKKALEEEIVERGLDPKLYRFYIQGRHILK